MGTRCAGRGRPRRKTPSARTRTRRTNMADPNDTPGPTPAERLRLARAHQARALRRADPLHATIGLLVGDVAVVTHRLLEAALAEAADGPAPAGAGPLPSLT